MESTQLLIVGCGPAGGIAAREAAASGIETVVLEKDYVVGAKRVCAAGLRPGFCRTFDLPSGLVHFDTPRMALFDAQARCHDFALGPAHTTTREELDGCIGDLARSAGADVRTGTLFHSMEIGERETIVEYGAREGGERKRIAARNVFLATGATARLEDTPFAYRAWQNGLITCFQYRVYLDRPAAAQAYRSLELHYYKGVSGRQIVAWMFPKRDHLTVGLGVMGKMAGAQIRAETDAFTARVRERLYPGVEYRLVNEGHLLYGRKARPVISHGGVMVGGTAAGLVDATNGEGIYEAAMSGRIAAEMVASKLYPHKAARRYADIVREKFYRRLNHRDLLMRYLERQPRRYAILFQQLATTPRFADILQREDSHLSMNERFYLYGQALKFFARAASA